MVTDKSFQKSFFIRFLWFTILAGNIYILLQSIFHTLNLHFLDLYVRWYAFNAPSFYHIPLLIGTLITIGAAFKIRHSGMDGYKIYLISKLIVFGSYLILILKEYQLAKLPFPYLLIPALLLMESIYPIVLYISLRKSVKRRSY